MSHLSVVRDELGHIKEIKTAATQRERASYIVASVAILAIGLCLIHWYNSAEYPHGPIVRGALKLGLIVTVGGLYGVFRNVSRFVRRGDTQEIIADSLGVRFTPYPEIGVVPWANIEGFSVAEVDVTTFGESVLVANVASDGTFPKKVRTKNPFGPGGRYALPFATVTGSNRADIRLLKSALEEILKESSVQQKN